MAVLAAAAVLAAVLVWVIARALSRPVVYSSTCIYPRESIQALDAIDELTGHQFTCVMVYANATATWAEWEDPWFMTTTIANEQWARWARQDEDRRLVITLSLVPTGVPANWRQLCADGDYNGYARTLGAALVAGGLAASVVRLAPEANGQTAPTASAGDSAAQLHQWARCWAQIAEAMRAPGAHFLFDWTINAAYRVVPFAEYYPGDAAVDIIGIDQYDALVDGKVVPPGNARWRLLAGQPGGLDALVAFARQHKKPLSVPEWGEVGAPVSGGGGDDPVYVAHMAALFRRQHVIYESYFDESEGGTLKLSQAPKALAVYKAQVVRANA